MDPVFNDIYRDRVEIYRLGQLTQFSQLLLNIPLDGFRQAPPRLLTLVTEAIEAGARELQPSQRLRADARLFLTINLHQMVLLPLADGRSPRELSQEVADGIESDAREIVRMAARIARERNEITAGHVVRATAEILDKLTLKSWRLWD